MPARANATAFRLLCRNKIRQPKNRREFLPIRMSAMSAELFRRTKLGRIAVHTRSAFPARTTKNPRSPENEAEIIEEFQKVSKK